MRTAKSVVMRAVKGVVMRAVKSVTNRAVKNLKQRLFKERVDKCKGARGSIESDVYVKSGL